MEMEKLGSKSSGTLCYKIKTELGPHYLIMCKFNFLENMKQFVSLLAYDTLWLVFIIKNYTYD